MLITQPWHNPTYHLMRLLGYLVLTIYFILFKCYKNNDNKKFKFYGLFIILLTLVNYAKPNFFLGFAPAMLIVLVYDLITSKGKQLKNIIMFGCCVLLTMPVLFLQSATLFGSGSNASIIISTEQFLTLFSNSSGINSIISNLLFPLFTTIVYFCIYFGKSKKELDASILVQSWLMFAISFFERFFLFETGPREGHGNFLWGCFFFTDVLYIVCFVEWITLFNKGYLSRKNPLFYIGVAIYLIHFGMGIRFLGFNGLF